MRLCSYQPDIAPNLGTMIRTAACLGVPLDIIEPCGFPLSLKALRRAAMDYADLADMTRHDSWDAFQATHTSARRILMTTKGAAPLYDFAFKPDDILIMGRESAGVPDEIHAACDAHVVIPIDPRTRSLNVAISASIAISEALRQNSENL